MASNCCCYLHLWVSHFLKSYHLPFSCWSGLAGSGRGIEWRVSEFNVINKWDFTSSSRAIWKFNPLGWILSTQLKEIHVSSLISSGLFDTVINIGDWVVSLTSWVKFSLFLLGYLMLFIWDDNASVDNWIINLEISSSSGISWYWNWSWVDSFKDFTSGNNSIW